MPFSPPFFAMREHFPPEFDEWEKILDQEDIIWMDACLIHNGRPFLALRLDESGVEIEHRGPWRWRDADGNILTVKDQAGCDLFIKKRKRSYRGIAWADDKSIGLQMGENIVYLDAECTSISRLPPEEDWM